MRFGQRQGAAQLAAGQAGEQALLLCVGTAREDGAERRPLHHQQIAGVVADPTELLDRDAGGECAAGATIFGREGQGEQAQILQQLEHVLRVLGASIDFVRARSDLLSCDASHQVLDVLLIVVQFVAHRVV